MVRSTVSLAMTLVALSGGRTTTTLGFASIGRGARPSSSSSSSFPSSSAVVVPPSRGDGGRPTTSGIASEGRRTRSNVVVVDVDDRRLASRRRGAASAVRLAIAVVLGAVVLLAPPFSPAARATTTSTFAPAAAAAAAGITTVPTFPTSRALGSFRLLPSGAELELCLRLLYAACCGAFVGLERSSSDRPAGVRTMALVGLGAAAYTVCSTHGFLPHAVLGISSGSPLLNNVKVDLSRMASNVASGVGFIGAGAIHKSRLHGVGTEEQNIVAGLTTAAAVWCSAAVGVASGAGLYYVAAVATFATTAILKYARVPKDRHEDHDNNDDGPGFSRMSTALTKSNDRVDDDGGRSRPHRGERAQERLTRRDEGSISGLFGKKDAVVNYNPENNAYVDQDAVYDRYSKDIHPIIIKEIKDPRFEKYLGLLSRLGDNAEGVVASDVLIEEEQAVVSSRDVAKNEQDALEAEK
jgi:putative Mg2+ transporter-C (MgtC) family protein